MVYINSLYQRSQFSQNSEFDTHFTSDLVKWSSESQLTLVLREFVTWVEIVLKSACRNCGMLDMHCTWPHGGHDESCCSSLYGNMMFTVDRYSVFVWDSGSASNACGIFLP